MKITFLGAAKTVTGSCYYVETKKSKFFVDCGMFQGYAKENAMNEQSFHVNPSELDFIILTHAHIDHSGRIPKAFIDGFKGEIISTKPTKELCAIMLPDSGHIQEMEAEWTNRKRARAGKPPIKPLYTFQDAIDSLRLFRSVPYSEIIQINDSIRVRFNDAGHILGSAIVELWVVEEGEETKVVFSGDLGNKNTPILRDPTIIESADYLVVESTYGNRLHLTKEDKVERFVNIISETVEKGGNIIIPSFAVGRTQEIIYYLNSQVENYNEKIKKLFNIPVFIDSPLAISATEVFRKNLDCFDDEAKEYIQNGDNPLEFPSLKFTKTADESKALNELKDSSIIISASGMCDAGRIKHHLKHNLWRKNSTILFVGYQAAGTLGRKIVDGMKKVKIFGEEITVNARIEMLDGFSGHADKDGLLAWISAFKKKPKKIIIIHGEEEVMNDFSKLINEKFAIPTIIPSLGETITVHATKAENYEKKPIDKKPFVGLAMLEHLETLKEEMDDLSELLKNDLRNEKEDTEVEMIRSKLKNLEKSIGEVLKN